MKKNILRMTAIVLLLVAVISLSACSSGSNEDDCSSKEDTYHGFTVVSTQKLGSDFHSYLTIMYDPDTLVMYGVTFGEGTSNSIPSQIVPLYNADGTLKTYSPNAESN